MYTDIKTLYIQYINYMQNDAREMLAELTDPDARQMISRTHAMMSASEFEDVVLNMDAEVRTAFEAKMRRGCAPEERAWAKAISTEITEYLASPERHRG